MVGEEAILNWEIILPTSSLRECHCLSIAIAIINEIICMPRVIVAVSHLNLCDLDFDGYKYDLLRLNTRARCR